MSQKKVEIYTWASCPYCHRATALLERKGVEFIEYKIDGDDEAREKMIERANGARTLPQIFVDEVHHIGGCDDLHQMEAEGKLDALIGI